MEDPRPGLITADNPLWTIDVALDNALIAVGFKSASDVVHKRASEALVAAEANDSAAMERAVEETQRTAERAHGVNGDGLDHAEQLLLGVRDMVRSHSHDGIDSAVGDMRVAQERFPTYLPERRGVLDRVDRSDRGDAPASGGDG